MTVKINMIDIGSVGGFDLPWKKHLNLIDRSLSFEPNEPAILEGKSLKYNCAVWDFDGEAQFYVSGRNGTGSSLLKQNYRWVEENFSTISREGKPYLNSTWSQRSKIYKRFCAQLKSSILFCMNLRYIMATKIPFIS